MNSATPRFSLIVATVNRTAELERLLQSLDRQTWRPFEVIVVDQNPDDRLEPILRRFHDQFPIVHVRSRLRGASRSRNIGLRQATGDLVAFPDDDCEYDGAFLREVVRFFQEHPQVDGLTARSADQEGKSTVTRFDRQAGPVSKLTVWVRSCEFTMIFRRSAIEGIWFDEELGVGAGTPWGADEGPDFLLRVLARGAQVRYEPSLRVFHPATFVSNDPSTLRRANSYACGMGRVLRKHSYPFWFVAYVCGRALIGALLALLRGNGRKALYHWVVFWGRVRGWIG